MSRVLLNDICSDIVDCVNKTAPTVDFETPYKMLRTSNVRDGKIFIDDLKCVTREVYEKWNRRIVPQTGDIILTREAPLGEVGMLRDWVNLFLGQRLMLYRVDESKANNKYVLYSFQCHDIQSQISALASGSTVQHMRVPDAEKITIELPSRLQQDRIAFVLSSYDELIYINDRRIVILEEMAQRLYRKEIKKSKNTCSLGEVVQFRRGRTITKATISEGSVPVVAGGVNPAYYHNEANTKAPVLTVSASGANAGYVNLYHVDVWASDCSYIDCNDSEHVFYFYALMKNFQSQITFMQRGSAQPHVYPDDISRLQIPVLSQESLYKLSKACTNIFQTIGNLKRKNETLRNTRDLLLPHLISGDIDVSNIDILI